MSRVLGLDYGSKRVGLAISDEIGMTARPLEVVSRNELVGKLRELIDEYQLERVVIGMPSSLRGHDGESARGAREMAAEVEEVVSVPVEFVDERFTSRLAESALLESGMRRRDRRERVDKVAAAIILQEYLDRCATGNEASTPAVETDT